MKLRSNSQTATDDEICHMKCKSTKAHTIYTQLNLNQKTNWKKKREKHFFSGTRRKPLIWLMLSANEKPWFYCGIGPLAAARMQCECDPVATVYVRNTNNKISTSIAYLIESG